MSPSPSWPADCTVATKAFWLPSYIWSPICNRVVLVPPRVSSIPYLDGAMPPSKLIWFSKSVPVLIKSIIPSPNRCIPSLSVYSSSSSSNALLRMSPRGTVKVTMSLPSFSTKIWCSIPVPDDPEVPATNAMFFAFSLDLPPSMNANSSTSKVRYSALCSAS
mgnify:CR=1 FL=1